MKSSHVVLSAVALLAVTVGSTAARGESLDKEPSQARLDAAVSAAERRLETAPTEEERDRARRDLALALYQRAIDRLYPSLQTFRDRDGRPTAPRRPPSSAEVAEGRESLRQAAEALRLAASTGTAADRREVLLARADALVRLDENTEALKALDDYAAARGESPLAEDLRCWSTFVTGQPLELRGLLGDPAGGPRPWPTAGFEPPVKFLARAAEYTSAARKACIEGAVVLSAIVDRDGEVACAQALTSLPEGLDQAALEMIKTWRFNPATLDGDPVASIYRVTFWFSLQTCPPISAPRSRRTPPGAWR